MNLKRVFNILIIILVLISSVNNNISYSTEKNKEDINQNQLINNPDGIKKEINNSVINLEETQIDDIIKDSGVRSEKDLDETIVETLEITEFNIDGLQLREGISSDEVLRIKRFLIAKGYTDLVENYYFDLNTRNIVMEYQRKNSLNPDGIIGPNTFSVINEDMKTNSISIPDIDLNLPENVPDKIWILINKESNTLYHYNSRNLINKYPIASGKTPSHTPEGKFSIIVKFVNPYWGGAGRYTPIKGGAPNNPLGKRWLGLNIKGGGTYGIHGNADVYSIGKHVSLGCIRMFNEDVEFLFDIIDYNTPVWIFASVAESVDTVEEILDSSSESVKVQEFWE